MFSFSQNKKYAYVYEKYKEYTMIPKSIYKGNLMLCNRFKNVSGCIVECGVWRGGMIAGVAELLGPERNYFLFDSFEGLPQAREIDGPAANAWQNNKTSPLYLDNCKAEMKFAQKALEISGAKNVELIKGWFNETLPLFSQDDEIAILRLDGDWYDSTTDCLTNLFPKVNKGGLVIIDDYYAWDGCSRAVHDYLSKNNAKERIRESEAGVCYLIKS